MIDIERILLERDKSERVEKLHGVVNFKLNKPNLQYILDDLGFTDHKIVGGNFFTTPNPFHIHTDNGKDNEPDFNILIPLSEGVDHNTILFDQTYNGWASHFWVGSMYKYFPDPVYNLPKRDFINVNDIVTTRFDIELYTRYLSHLPYESVQGLSIKEVHKWKLGEHYIFECNRLHASSNFKDIKEGLTLLVKNPS